eukprot:jgi/Mesvir1/23394/Mv21089-RA.1
MASVDAIKNVLNSHWKGPVDNAIFDYVSGVLTDEDLDLGKDGEGVYDAVGGILVGSGGVKNEEDCIKLCRELSDLLSVSREDSVRSSSSSFSGSQEVRTLNAPVRLGGDVADEEEDEGGNKLCHPPANLVFKRDLAKLERRRKKEEKQQQVMREAHVAAAAEVMKAIAGQTVVAHVTEQGASGGSRDLKLDNFSVSVAGADLITDASVTLAYGRHYGLVGRNGTGKTTFLRHLSRRELKGIPKHMQILHVEQEVTGDDTSVLESVLACDTERTQLLAEEAAILASAAHEGKEGGAAAAGGPEDGKVGGAAAAKDAPGSGENGVTLPAAEAVEERAQANGAAPGSEDPVAAAAASTAGGAKAASKPMPKAPASAERLAAIYKRLEAIDAYSAEARAAVILAGLGFTPELQKRATKTFSGGWRMRMSLARALFIQPDVLLLDEPTNHLDLHAVIWLEDYLEKWPKTIIVVSHAREFLNKVTTDTMHLFHQKLTTYKGNYDVFEKTMHERMRNQQKAYEANERSRKHVQEFIDRFRYNAKRASLVQSRIKALERMTKIECVETDPEYVFRFPDPDEGPSPPVISFTDVWFNYPGGQFLFKDLNFGIDMESRLAMVGPNGIGKSTLLKLISGELAPTKGVVYRNPKVRLGVFSQHHVDGLDLSLTPLALMVREFPGVPEQQLRSHLGSFGVSGPLAIRPIYTLSGGQKSRVAFARITWTKPHIMLLDEPSNHLDIEAVEALIQGLAVFKGGVLMVSHDQHLIEGSVDELWAIHHGTATAFHGSFEDYKKRLKAMQQ